MSALEENRKIVRFEAAKDVRAGEETGMVVHEELVQLRDLAQKLGYKVFIETADRLR